MDRDAIALFRELADRSPSEREAYYARHQIPAALRAEVESLLRFDGETGDSLHGPVAAAAEKVLLGHPGAGAVGRDESTAAASATSPQTIPALSSETGEGRFPSGTLLGGRYRIVSLLGRGGMGDVYRATDLKLRQPVALKFLPEATARDARLLARFHGEVRLARQISHPNVCRVYDIGEVDGAAFISMEYIDGEDLASLLRRIGHLPHAKALEIARRLCAGLAAAHDKGVVHHDLKPANIMIDGRGQVFITDFGLASTARDLDTHIRSGTPAYMAPEQLDGRGVSVRSDIYSLGLVLYEMFSGRQPFDCMRTPADQPASIASVARDIDPAVALAIERCIKVNPRDRPVSALAVAASLPGGNPLAEALAAGVTPSPQMVAASHEGAAMSVRAVVLSFGFVLVGLVAAVVLDGRSAIVHLTPFDNPPEVLSQKAREMIAAFGYTAPPVDRASGFFRTSNYWRYAERNESPSEYRAQVARGQPPLVWFWYRQGPQYFVARDPVGGVSQFDPPLADPGEVYVAIDQSGRLVVFEAVPPQEDYSTKFDRPGDWDALFAAAGVDRSRFSAVEPQWIPRVTFDDRAAWSGTFAHAPSVPMRIEAASWKGRPVYFRLIGPWTNFQGRIVFRTRAQIATLWASLGLVSIVVAGAGLLAWRNHRLGRGDLQGASRLAAVVLGCWLLSWLVTAHHVPTLGYYQSAVGSAFPLPLYIACIVWVLYMAIEPYVRRRWPQSVIAWTRVLAGRIRDPLVGGHVLAGTAFGVGLTIWLLVESWLLFEEGVVRDYLDVSVLNGAGWALSSWLGSFTTSVAEALGLLVLLLLIRVILRRDWVASVAFVALIGALAVLESPRPLIEAAFDIPALALYSWILIRLGVLPMFVADFVGYILSTFPLTTDFSAWYSGATLFALATVLALAIWSFRVALAGRPLLRDEFLEARA